VQVKEAGVGDNNEELDKVVGRDRHVDVRVRHKKVIVSPSHREGQETLRLYPPSPIVIRSLLEDCTLSGGYHIPANTHVMVNVWKVHRDERVWPNPDDFEPERFLTSHKSITSSFLTMDLFPKF
jgi:hypothetical protein